MSRHKQKLILSIVTTDKTFERGTLRGESIWVGKCIHCNRKLAITQAGTPLGHVTIEHIWPQAHGGSDAPDNLALACGRCNHEKGVRHDSKKANDPRFLEVVEQLREKRRRRWR